MNITRVPHRKLGELLGTHTKAGQTALLRSYGLPALPDALGWPIVLEDDLRRVLGQQQTTTAPPARRKRPRLDPATM